MNRRSLAGVIVLTWLGALSWLGFRELGAASSAGMDNTLRTVPPGAAYYVVSVADMVVGYASHTVDTVPEGVVVDDRLILELPGIDGASRVNRRTVANLTNTFQLRDFETTVGSDRGGFVSRGTISSDSTLDLQLDISGATYASALNTNVPVVLRAYLPLWLVFGQDLAAADTLSVAEFDPVRWESEQLSLEVLADSTLIFPDSAMWDSLTNVWVPARWDTLRAWKIRRSAGGQQSDFWIDELGQLISATHVSGFTVTRNAFEIAFHNFQDRTVDNQAHGSSNLIHQTPIAAGIISLTEDLSEMRVHIGNPNVAPETFVDGRQDFAGDTLVVRRDNAQTLRSTLRLPGSANGPAREYLRATPAIQADDPRIQARARLIIDGIRNAARATDRLIGWLQDNVEKQPSVGVPSALSVLETRVGDVSDHSTLFIALARAVGLPARPATGLVYIDGRFYYHVWAEVDLGSGWVTVDPTFGQFPADASHIRFTSHLPAGDLAMVRLIGRPMLSVISAQEQN